MLRSAILILAVGLSAAPAPSQAARPTIYLIGDSTVRNGDATGANGQWGWGEPFVDWFDAAKVAVSNKAIGGRSSRTFLTEGRWDEVRNALKPGDFVLMQFGHNDGGELFKSNRPRASLKGTGDETQDGVVEMTGKAETVRTYGSYLRQYVREAKAKGATPIVLSLAPRSMWKDGRIIRAESDYAKWAEDVARAESAAFIDLNDDVAKRYEAIGRDTVETFFPADHTHRSEERRVGKEWR